MAARPRAKKRRCSPPREEGPRQQLLRKRRRSTDENEAGWPAFGSGGEPSGAPAAKRVDSITEGIQKITVGTIHPQWVQLGDGVQLPNQLGGGSPAVFGGSQGGEPIMSSVSGPGGGVLMPLYKPVGSPKSSPGKRCGGGSPIIDLSLLAQPTSTAHDDVPDGVEARRHPEP